MGAPGLVVHEWLGAGRGRVRRLFQRALGGELGIQAMDSSLRHGLVGIL